MSKPTPNPRRAAAAKRGWETRRRNHAAKQEVERSGYPPPYFYPSVGGRQVITSASGYASVQTLMKQYQSWQMIAAAAIADRVMKLEPIVVVETRISNGTVKLEELDDHPLKQLLQTPNPTFSMKMLLRLLSLWLTQVGDAYLLKVTDDMNVTRELYPLVPSNIMKKAGKYGIEGYVYHGEGGTQEEYAPDEIIRIFKPDPTAPFEGVGNLGPNVLTYDTDLFMDQTLRKYYQNDATPKTVLKAVEGASIPKGDTKERWEKEWLNKYHRRLGSDTGLPAWLPPGFDIDTLDGLPTKDLTLLLEYLRDKILAANGVPGSIVGLDRNINRATAEASMVIFDKQTIEPQATLIADALTMQLARDFDPHLKVRFNNVVQEDVEFKLRQEDQDLRHGVKSINQVLEDRGLDPVVWGEVPLDLREQPPAEPPEDNATDAPPSDSEEE